ncbi:venom protease-like isoform X1 [Varroa destructor]|uniref:Peptidase S1 domain-containing protein n=1 Tax=Varroa destructor TaxID=109461 RepID=A0A7M7L0C8_VARDE|nr:venom protease-like isoform X1 [Varroa destructor]
MFNKWLVAASCCAVVTAIDSSLINTSTCGISTTGRIVNGVQAASGELPWVVNIHIYVAGGINRCSGSILTVRHVLTAAHCLDRSTKHIVIMYGSNTLNTSQRVDVSSLIVHPKFDSAELLNDVMVLRLARDVVYSRFVRPICLPDGNLRPRNLVQRAGLVAGFGALIDPNYLERTRQSASKADTSILMKTSLRILDDRECYKRYLDEATGSSHFHIGYQMCTFEYNSDTCVGDSGGALTVSVGGRFYQVGIVSGGLECAGTSPGVYVNVFNYVDWIARAVKHLR